MERFFTSDTHFGHEKLVALRGFASAEEMDEGLIDNWNAAVGKNDIVYFLGDLSFSNTARTLQIVRRLNGSINWVLGNHDTKLAKNQELRSRFSSISVLREIKVDAQRLVLCHFPLMVCNRNHYGSFMLHGHSHGFLRHPHPMRLLDVGVDPQGLKPISYEDVHAALSKIEYTPLDQHRST